MDNNDKPFACSFPGCNEKFVTEDRLSFHIQKHDLNFEGLTASLFTDQTPTPTTFLRDCESMGLFQDLPLTSKNPFDESFRKAVTDPDADNEADGADTPSIPILPDSASILGSINTPTSAKDLSNFTKFRHVFLTPDINKLQSQISNGNLDTPNIDDRRSLRRCVLDSPITPTNSSLVLGLPYPRSRKSSTSTLSDGGGAENGSTVGMPSSGDMMLITSDVSDSLITVSGGSVSEDDNITVVSPSMEAECSVTAATKGQQVTTTAQMLPIGLSHKISTVSPTQSTLPLVTSTLQPANPSTQSLVMLHFDKTGGAYLVPATQQTGLSAQAISSTIIPVSVSPNSITSYSQQMNGGQNGLQIDPSLSTALTSGADTSLSSLALAKMKLKQALTKQQPNYQPSCGTTLSDSETSSNRSRHSSSPTGGLKRMCSRSDDEHLNEFGKKMKSLQRNRDAARRCRKKKKVFLETLEERLKGSNHFITQLKSENSKLKMEIAQLKSLFIAHRDCEVTKKQQSEGSLSTYPVSEKGPASYINS